MTYDVCKWQKQHLVYKWYTHSVSNENNTWYVWLMQCVTSICTVESRKWRWLTGKPGGPAGPGWPSGPGRPVLPLSP